MSFLKLVIGIAFMSAVLFFAVLNLEETTDIRLWPDAEHHYRDVPVVVALLSAYLLGIISYFLISLVRDVRLRSQLGRLRKENRSLIDEVHQLRGSALNDLPMEEAQGAAVPEGRKR